MKAKPFNGQYLAVPSLRKSSFSEREQLNTAESYAFGSEGAYHIIASKLCDKHNYFAGIDSTQGCIASDYYVDQILEMILLLCTVLHNFSI